MKRVLTERQIRLTKSLGQNFLHDSNQLQRILAAAELDGSDPVLEIGPGLGPLTNLLVAHATEVLAIEKDARLVDLLKENQWEKMARGKLRIVHADAMEFLKKESQDWSEWKLVANLPYTIASPLLVEMALSEQGPRRMVVTLQLEVAKRLMAKPGQADYGILTLLVHQAYEPAGSFKIPASCFFPEPRVHSACVCLIRRTKSLLPPALKLVFVEIVKRSFSQRRKMMFKLLKEDWPEEKLSQAFDQLSLATQSRAEKVSPEQFAALAELLMQKS